MQVYSAQQIRDWDAYTIAHEPISSLGLMDRAVDRLTEAFTALYPGPRNVHVLAGQGNNGGDGLGMAMRLHWKGYTVRVSVARYGGKPSPDYEAQRERLHRIPDLMPSYFDPGAWPSFDAGEILIDALFGTGLSRPLEGPWAELIEMALKGGGEVLAIDLPSGMMADHRVQGPCMRATHTLSMQTPKLAFMLPENAPFIGQWTCVDIGLHPDYVRLNPPAWGYFTAEDAAALLRPRPIFGHKGTFGHALLLAGSYGKAGAAILAATACLRAGAGMVTVRAPSACVAPIQSAIPEAMCDPDSQAERIAAPPGDTAGSYDVLCAGPGIGQHADTAEALWAWIRASQGPMVLDADALNLLSAYPDNMALIPAETILTPHVKEFARLFGDTPDSLSRMALARQKARAYGLYIVLKGAHTLVACPDGQAWFNSSGNAGMATAGSGDVLAGILAGLLAQGYSPRNAALLGVWMHGAAGDRAAARLGQAGMLAGDIPPELGLVLADLQT